MCFKAFYTSIYNIRLGFIKIESKTGKEDARTKSAKKMGSLRRGKVVHLGEASLRLGRADRGQKMVSVSPRRTGLRLGVHFFS